MAGQEPRIGSLFSGTGQLDEAVKAVFGGEVVWHSQYEPPDKNGKPDVHQYAAKILARHYFGVPNLGDITLIEWVVILALYGPIDILTGGFPCTDVSSAGQRAGLIEGTRSGLWLHMARAISILQPRLVVIENVEGLLSSKAAGDLEPCPHCVGDGDSEPPLRALGAVLGDLASLGFDAEWAVVAASEVGAPHRRKRVIIYAWRAAVQDAHLEPGGERRLTAPGQAEAGWTRADLGGRGGTPAADPRGVESERRGIAGVLGSQEAAEPCEGNQRERARYAAGGSREAAADAAGQRHGNAGPEGERGIPAAPVASRVAASPDADHGRPGEEHQGADVVVAERAPNGRGAVELSGPDRGGEVGLGRAPEEPATGRAATAGESGDRGNSAPDADSGRRRAEILDLRQGQPDLDWGDYGPAIRRWEHILGRPAPWPTDALGRLSPVFTEWHMGYPDGWVTCTPGLTRNAMLRALGNGVVPQQMEAGIRLLHQRAAADTFRTAA